MSCCGSGSCGSGCGACKLICGVVALLLTLTTIAAALGVYYTHMVAGGLSFGALHQSVSLFTFIVSLVVWLKVFKKMCPCSTKGACPGCGTSPCKC